MELVRTPDHRFERLSSYPYPMTTLPLGGAEEPRLAYVAEGPHDGLPVLLLHGSPTWSYLWRHAIPMLTEGGCRVVAPDLVGFGRSDKILRPREHNLDQHTGWITALLEHLDLRDLMVVAHGAANHLALKLLAADATRERADRRIDRAVAIAPLSATSGTTTTADLAASELIARGCTSALSPATRTAYDAPYPDAELTAGLRAQPSFLEGWPEDLAPIDLPLLVVTGDADTQCDADWMIHVPGPAAKRRKLIIPGAGHYVPEDRGPELALALLAFLVEKA